MFCTRVGVVPWNVQAPTNLPSSDSTPPAQDEGMQQQTWQYVHYLSCYSLVSSADTQCASLMLALVPASHIKHQFSEDKLTDANEDSSKNGVCCDGMHLSVC